MSSTKIIISKDFSEAPAGRYISDGPFSGENFRDRVLFPALETFDSVEVELDGTLGYGSSFLEEAFGGLIRECGMSLAQIDQKLKIHSSRRLYLTRTKQYMVDAEMRRNGK